MRRRTRVDDLLTPSEVRDFHEELRRLRETRLRLTTPASEGYAFGPQAPHRLWCRSWDRPRSFLGRRQEHEPCNCGQLPREILRIVTEYVRVEGLSAGGSDD